MIRNFRSCEEKVFFFYIKKMINHLIFFLKKKQIKILALESVIIGDLSQSLLEFLIYLCNKTITKFLYNYYNCYDYTYE